MPNVLAHSYITTEVVGIGVPDVVLASTLPDFVGMYQDKEGLDKREAKKLFPANLSPEFDFGNHLHHRTDSIFNSQPESVEITMPLAADLEAVGIKPRASRLAANFLGDVMIDAALRGDHHAEEAFEQLRHHALGRGTYLHHEAIDYDFRMFVQSYFAEDVPRVYVNPVMLAAIVHGRLKRHARRAADPDKALESSTFSEDQIQEVSSVIVANTERVSRFGLNALQRTIAELRRDPGA